MPDCSHILVVVHSPVGAGSLARTVEFLALDQSHLHRRYLEITYCLWRLLRVLLLVVVLVVLAGRHRGSLKRRSQISIGGTDCDGDELFVVFDAIMVRAICMSDERLKF
jgi:hypothetical protein